MELLAVQPGESVLEIGFGTGHTLLALAEAVGPAGRVTGIDISTGMREVASKRIQAAGFAERVQLMVQAVPPLPLDANSVDVVTMSFTLELFPLDTIPAVLSECKRVLKPGGRLGVVSMATVVRTFGDVQASPMARQPAMDLFSGSLRGSQLR